MKLLLSFGLVLLLLGCSNEESQYPYFSIEQKQPTLANENFTEEDAIALFKKSKDDRHYKIQDTVIVKDNQFPMLKAVISFYDQIENNSCNLAFIYGDRVSTINFAANELDGLKTYEMNDRSQLTYVGDATVTTSIREIQTNEIINYKITFSYNKSTSTTNFEIVAEKPTK